MSRNEYMAALREALSVLPDEERANALRYYEEYFDDAGPENEQKAIEGLGDPSSIARQILEDYRELAAVPRPQGGGTAGPVPPPQAKPRRGWRGISPLALILLLLLAIPIGIPVAATLFGGLVAVLAVLAVVAVAVVIVVAVVPAALVIGGVVLAGFSFALWLHPASALATLGTALVLLSVGVLIGILMIKLCLLFVPPVFRGIVAILRWPFDMLRRRAPR